MSIKRVLFIILMFGMAISLTVTAYAGRSQHPDCGVEGWMTGGGSIFDTNGVEVAYEGRTTHGFVVHCPPRHSDNLQINWEGNRFHLTDLEDSVCLDTPGIDPNPPDADFDTFYGVGTGRLNNVKGYTVEFVFTDAGEPGVADAAIIQIYNGDGTVLDITGPLTFGNHQAHSH